MIRTKTILLGVAILSANLFIASEAEAGPLLDWLRGRRTTSTSNFQQQPAFNYYGTQGSGSGTQVAAGGQVNVAANSFGLKPGQCMKTCQKTCTRTVVNYVPYTAYRTSWKRVPVTTYRPVTNSDPCTGCTVTCMRPCTSYTYQMQRVPYTTQRPVYRQETYQVPVTTITNDCATGGCNTGCDTCGTGQTVQQGFGPTAGSTTQSFAPPTPATQGSSTQGFAPPAPSFPTSPNFQTPSFPSEPANIAPSIGGSTSRLQAPRGTLTTAGRFDVGKSSNNRVSQKRSQVSTPRNLRTAAASPVQRDWDYSPVRLASYNQPASVDRAPVRSLRTKSTTSRSTREVNSFWKEVK